MMKRPITQFAILATVFVTLIYILGGWLPFVEARVSLATMAVTHTVLFQWKTDASPDAVREACARMMALKQGCIHPTSKKPYVLSLKGGKDNSPEGLQNGITHGVVAEFASSEDRNYYVKDDPAHQAFIKSIGDIVAKVIVVDFSDGVF